MSPLRPSALTRPGASSQSTVALTAAEDGQLRSALRHCSPATYYAAYQFRLTGDAARLPVVIAGLIERYVSAERRFHLVRPADRLRLSEDLGIDSLTLMELVLVAEDVLRIDIATSEVGRLRTWGEAQRFLAEKARHQRVPIRFARSGAGRG